MIVTYRIIVNNSIVDTDIENLFNIRNTLILGIDGSTTNTGICLLDYTTGSLLATLALTREKNESSVRYKVNFKKVLLSLLSNLNINLIFYEQPFINSSYTNADTIKALYSLRTSFDEIKIENEPRFDSITYIETPNTKWKSILLSGKVPKGTDSQKKSVRDFILSRLSFLDRLTEDEFDSIGIGFAGYLSLRTTSVSDMEAKKKVRAFKYNSEFIGANTDEEFIEEFVLNKDNLKIPDSLLDNTNLSISHINGKGLFNNYIYSEMGDDDMVIILKFSSKHHSNVVLEHRLSYLTKYKYIFAIIWRKSRHISRR